MPQATKKKEAYGGIYPEVHEDIQEARRVLDIESIGLRDLKQSLDANFIKAVDLLYKTTGRVVVSGIGKSGHIGRKISSTLASTGTPSFFVHPVEASHGDLGMLLRNDSLLVLSNSGETKELAEIITFARSHTIPLIAITQHAQSTLGKMANVCLLLPKVPEACPLELAPTTSSLATLALGDALAMVLLKRRGFTHHDFGRLHPGGRLGAQLIKLEKIMHRGEALPLVHIHRSVKEALLIMTSKSFGCVGVMDEANRLVGIITDGDLRRHMDEDLLQKKALDIMTPSPKILTADTLVEEAAAFMNANGISGVFIADEAYKPLGFIHVHDCLRHRWLI